MAVPFTQRLCRITRRVDCQKFPQVLTRALVSLVARIAQQEERERARKSERRFVSMNFQRVSSTNSSNSEGKKLPRASRVTKEGEGKIK